MISPSFKDEYDCIVIGAGPGGCATSAMVAQAGYDVLLIEREKLPRFHVGESLMPEAFWCFEQLGILDKMRESDFVRKKSVQFVSHSGKESNPFFFEKHDPRECSQTWQVERSAFDQMLFDNAAEKGACCRDKTRVTNVLFDDGRATGVELGLEDGSTQQVKAKVVVDATGLSAILANHLNLKQEYEHLKKIAVWTYFKNAEREPGPHGGATIILHTKLKDSWFWFIPLRDNITSVGVVGNRDGVIGIIERKDGCDGTEYFFLRNACVGLDVDNGCWLNEETFVEPFRPSATEQDTAFVASKIDIAHHAVVLALRDKGANTGGA